MEAWCIYDHPRDYPDHFVLRRWVWDVPDGVCQLFDAYEDAVAAVPPGKIRVTSPQDDFAILETWI